MKKIQILGAAFFAVLAFGAIVSASASAEGPVWLQEGREVTEKKPATTHGTLLLHHTGGTTGNSKVECTGLFVGSIGPGKEDLIELVESLTGTEKDLVHCEIIEGATSCENKLATVHAEKLPWHTELVHEEVAGKLLIWDLFTTESPATGEPAYDMLCKTILGTLLILCEGNVRAHDDENLANGGLFLWKGTESLKSKSCSDGGEAVIEQPTGTSIEVLGFTALP